MTITLTPEEVLAAALFELRVLLSPYLGSENSAEAPVRVAAHLAYALHNHALAVLDGRSFEVAAALQSVARVDQMFGERIVERLATHAGKA